MAKIILRQEAINDLNKIWNYTFEKWSEKQADKYYTNIKIAFSKIGKNTNLGKEYYEIHKDLLGFTSGKHIIFYQIISADRIEVIRILHERMDLKSRMTPYYFPSILLRPQRPTHRSLLFTAILAE